MKRMIEEQGFKKVLYDESKKKNIELSEDLLNKFEKYKDMLLEYNEKINLTAITDEYEIIIKHFVDCLECTKFIEKNKNIIDVGTGAGFPGLVIAIYFGDGVNITLLDSLNKRLIFLNEVIKELKLSKVDIIHKRAEEAAQEVKYREKYDYVASRAVANLPILLEYTTPYLKIKGEAIIMKSNNLQDEINNSKKSLQILNCNIKQIHEYSLAVSEEEFNRNILIIKKEKNTPKLYPRSYGKIKKSPL